MSELGIAGRKGEDEEWKWQLWPCCAKLCLAGREQEGLRSLPSRATEMGNCRESSSGILCEPDLSTGHLLVLMGLCFLQHQTLRFAGVLWFNLFIFLLCCLSPSPLVSNPSPAFNLLSVFRSQQDPPLSDAFPGFGSLMCIPSLAFSHHTPSREFVMKCNSSQHTGSDIVPYIYIFQL